VLFDINFNFSLFRRSPFQNSTKGKKLARWISFFVVTRSNQILELGSETLSPQASHLMTLGIFGSHLLGIY
jgi:hypothetical protein